MKRRDVHNQMGERGVLIPHAVCQPQTAQKMEEKQKTLSLHVLEINGHLF